MALANSIHFIDKLPQLTSSEAVGIAFGDLIRPFGFVAAAFGESRETMDGRSWDFFFNTWPIEWLRQYQSNDYVRHDLVPMMARLSVGPFTWREAIAGGAPTVKQREHYNWAVSLGIVDVFAVPVHYPGDDFGLCVVISNHLIQDTGERVAIHLASIIAHQRCRELGGQQNATSAKNPLTQREVECLRWVFKGKSDTDIGKILRISHTTVHFHIERVKKKLGVRTRTQAAAMIMKLGYI